MSDFNTTKLKIKLGLDGSNGRCQKVLDSQIVKYLRETMPVDVGVMSANTRIVEPGKIQVQTPYAHYMNEGILYVNPKYGRTGFPVVVNGTTIGYKYFRGKRVPTNRKLNYRGGTERGAHYVERTCEGHFEDILNAVKESIK